MENRDIILKTIQEELESVSKAEFLKKMQDEARRQALVVGLYKTMTDNKLASVAYELFIQTLLNFVMSGRSVRLKNLGVLKPSIRKTRLFYDVKAKMRKQYTSDFIKLRLIVSRTLLHYFNHELDSIPAPGVEEETDK